MSDEKPFVLTNYASTFYSIHWFNTIFGVSFLWISVMAFLVTLFVGIIASLCTKPTPKDKVDYICMFPLPDRFCSIFPEGYFYSKTQRQEAKKKGETDGLVEKGIAKVMLDVLERTNRSTLTFTTLCPVSILRKSISGRHRPVRVALDLRRMLAGCPI